MPKPKKQPEHLEKAKPYSDLVPHEQCLACWCRLPCIAHNPARLPRISDFPQY